MTDQPFKTKEELLAKVVGTINAPVSGFVNVLADNIRNFVYTLSDVKIVALGDHWGSGTFTGGARPGRTPLGIAISLADMEKDPAAKVPPQGSGWLDGYLEADRR